jgi:hypothetical protein
MHLTVEFSLGSSTTQKGHFEIKSVKCLVLVIDKFGEVESQKIYYPILSEKIPSDHPFGEEIIRG